MYKNIRVKFEKNILKNNLFLEAIRIETNSNFFNSKQTIYICLKQKMEIPIIQVRNPINLNEIEKKASEIASFLKVSLKET